MVPASGRDVGTTPFQLDDFTVARTPANFRQADLARAVRAVKSAGLDVVRTEIGPDGKIVLIHASEVTSTPASPFDEWKAKRDAR